MHEAIGNGWVPSARPKRLVGFCLRDDSMAREQRDRDPFGELSLLHQRLDQFLIPGSPRRRRVNLVRCRIANSDGNTANTTT